MPAQPLTVQFLIDLAGGAAALGERLGCARTTVLDWRRANVLPGNRIAQISQELGISAAHLLPLAQLPRRTARAA